MSGGGARWGDVERELRERLEGVFGEQPEVVGKLVEAIEINARAMRDAEAEKTGARRY